MKLQAFVIIVRDVEISRGFYEGLLGERAVADHGPKMEIVLHAVGYPRFC
jgi:catechol 2,3-dioxygenase-like lactoylglutathione lyase family enzyme